MCEWDFPVTIKHSHWSMFYIPAADNILPLNLIVEMKFENWNSTYLFVKTLSYSCLWNRKQVLLLSQSFFFKNAKQSTFF